jgi:hypothetical protein
MIGYLGGSHAGGSVCEQGIHGYIQQRFLRVKTQVTKDPFYPHQFLIAGIERVNIASVGQFFMLWFY